MNTPPNSRRQPAYGERARSYERDTAARALAFLDRQAA